MAELKSQKFEIITSDYYSNCLIEAVKAKIHNPKIKITIVMPWGNEVFCPHVLWSDGVNDFDFGNEGKGDKWIKNWTLHKGHIRKRKLGFNEKYKCVCKARHRRNVPLEQQLADYHHMSELVNGKMAENARLRRINEKLTARAEAAEARADAAVEDLRQNGFCGSCSGCNAPHDPNNITWCYSWKWRGQEAGKGEAE